MAEILPIQVDKTKNEIAGRDAVEDGRTKKAIPKGVVLDKDGKPCRSCTSFHEWAAMTRKKIIPPQSKETPSTTATATFLPPDCPPDVETLGRSTWTLLHTIAATYPATAPPEKQTEMKTFIGIFSRIYPCWVCAEDFRQWIERPENKLVPGQEGGHLGGRASFGQWMCGAHNEVNRKLGKREFDCSRYEERWRTGWADGRCD
ncbi:FAD-linked sulfhydryl oxidase ALR [Choiromyces venosus 120613-1]|uniref:Sulfhydryl oxidase n=1 Tax=Choiromyces venosus 120613-1 TaxID=1336337 RepID=A0A3N4JTH4_9PEZI|nr:FAD-linked sulfhydryl oxidase ALR [Choiromyces venosus 120613-1]